MGISTSKIVRLSWIIRDGGRRRGEGRIYLEILPFTLVRTVVLRWWHGGRGRGRGRSRYG